MNSMKLTLLSVCLCGTASLLSSCNDDEDYTSEIPQFSDVTFHVLGSNNTELRVGDKIVATAVQSKKGHLLHGATMSWSSTPDAQHSFKAGVVYDAQNENPTDTIEVTAAGRYSLTFTSKYDVSGIYKIYNETVPFADGNGQVRYQTLSQLYYQVTITKNFTVLPAKNSNE